MPKSRGDKGKKSTRSESKKAPVDEDQLRRDLRDTIKSKETEKLTATTAMSSEAKPSRAEDFRIGGVEGGGTRSTLIVLDGRGKQLARVEGPGTNHWALGMKETATRINEMITRAKKDCEMPENHPLDCVGLFLSGCEEEKTNAQLVETLRQEFPAASREYVIGSDTIGSLSTGTANCGVVLIAGTGSNSLLVNPDGKTVGCGGWGHVIGDEGSAYSIAYHACKYVLDDIDGRIPAPHSTSYVWPAMRSYFKVTDETGMLPCLYANFDKSKIALFTKELVAGCEKGDPLCVLLFENNGTYLAQYINALARKADNETKLCPGGLKVICIGSVWKSWEFMKKGFLKEIQEGHAVDELTLAKLTVPSALGACYRAGDHLKCDGLKKTYDENTEAFYHYQRGDTPLDGVARASRNIANPEERCATCTKDMGVIGFFKSTFDWILHGCRAAVRLIVYFVAFCLSAVLTIASVSTIAVMIAMAYRYLRDDDDEEMESV